MYRCLEHEIWRFSCHRHRQTYKPIALPLPHAIIKFSGRGVHVCLFRKCCMVVLWLKLPHPWYCTCDTKLCQVFEMSCNIRLSMHWPVTAVQVITKRKGLKGGLLKLIIKNGVYLFPCKGVDMIFKVREGSFVTTARKVHENFWSYYVQNLKNTAIFSNCISNLLHIFGYPTIITVNTTTISSNFNNPI